MVTNIFSITRISISVRQKTLVIECKRKEKDYDFVTASNIRAEIKNQLDQYITTINKNPSSEYEIAEFLIHIPGMQEVKVLESIKRNGVIISRE